MKLDALQNLVFVHTNDEVKAFIERFHDTMMRACSIMPYSQKSEKGDQDRLMVISQCAIKYGLGKLKLDPALGDEAAERYVFKVARRIAIDLFRNGGVVNLPGRGRRK